MAPSSGEPREKLPGLSSLLEASKLPQYREAAEAWCDEVGAVELSELLGASGELADALGLKVMERRRLQKASAEWRAGCSEKATAVSSRWEPAPAFAAASAFDGAEAEAAEPETEPRSRGSADASDGRSAPPPQRGALAEPPDPMAPAAPTAPSAAAKQQIGRELRQAGEGPAAPAAAPVAARQQISGDLRRAGEASDPEFLRQVLDRAAAAGFPAFSLRSARGRLSQLEAAPVGGPGVASYYSFAAGRGAGVAGHAAAAEGAAAAEAPQASGSAAAADQGGGAGGWTDFTTECGKGLAGTSFYSRRLAPGLRPDLNDVGDCGADLRAPALGTAAGAAAAGVPETESDVMCQPTSSASARPVGGFYHHAAEACQTTGWPAFPPPSLPAPASLPPPAAGVAAAATAREEKHERLRRLEARRGREAKWNFAGRNQGIGINDRFREHEAELEQRRLQAYAGRGGLFRTAGAQQDEDEEHAVAYVARERREKEQERALAARLAGADGGPAEASGGRIGFAPAALPEEPPRRVLLEGREVAWTPTWWGVQIDEVLGDTPVSPGDVCVDAGGLPLTELDAEECGRRFKAALAAGAEVVAEPGCDAWAILPHLDLDEATLRGDLAAVAADYAVALELRRGPPPALRLSGARAGVAEARGVVEALLNHYFPPRG